MPVRGDVCARRGDVAQGRPPRGPRAGDHVRDGTPAAHRGGQAEGDGGRHLMVWLTQFLCPSRHCAFGAVWDDAAQTREGIERALRAQARQAGLREECGICGASVTPEHRALAMTLAEAEPLVKELERANL